MRFTPLLKSTTAVLFMGASSGLFAQTASTGTVSGQVTDPQAAVVKGAAVGLLDTATNLMHSTKTNDAGRYDFPNVAPGTYDLTVNSPGFALAKISTQKVEVGLSLTLNVSLQIGTTATTVEVRASAGADLQTLNSTVGS